VIAVLGGLEAFDQADSRIDRPIDAPRPLLGGILQAEFERIDLELLG